MTTRHDLTRKGASPPFHLVLADVNDLTALRLCRALGHVARAEFVTPEELFMAPHWSHDPLGQSRVELASGLVLDEASVLSIFNRVKHVAPLQFAASSTSDRIYAGEEFFALIISWLTGFGGRCVNRPHPGSVAGYAARSRAEGRLRYGADLHASSRARHLGLGGQITSFPEAAGSVLPGGPGQRLSETETRRVLIVGDTVSDDLPEALHQRLRAEMAHHQLTVAEASLTSGTTGWQLAALNPLPEVREEAEIALIIRHLQDVAQPQRGVA